MNSMESLDPNLLASPRQPTTAKQPAEPQKKKTGNPLRVLILSLIGFFAFLFFFLLKFPTASVTNYALEVIRQAVPAYNINAKNISWGILLGPSIEFESLEISPRFGVGPKILLDSATIKPSLLRMIPWKGMLEPAASFSAQAFSGSLVGQFQQGVSTSIDLEANALDLGKIEALTNKISLDGKLEILRINLEHGGRWSQTNGQFNLLGKSLRLDPSSLNLGMSLPILDLGTLNLTGKIQNGKGVIERFTVGEPGKDIEAQAQGTIVLKEPIFYSDLDLQIKFRVSEKILKVIPTLDGLLGLIAAKRSDGFYGTKIKGPILGMNMPTPWKE